MGGARQRKGKRYHKLYKIEALLYSRNANVIFYKHLFATEVGVSLEMASLWLLSVRGKSVVHDRCKCARS